MKILNIIRNRHALLEEGGRLFSLEKEYLKANVQGYKRSIVAVLCLFLMALITSPISIVLIILYQLVLPDLAVSPDVMSLMNKVVWITSLIVVAALIAAISIIISLKYQIKSVKSHFGM